MCIKTPLAGRGLIGECLFCRIYTLSPQRESSQEHSYSVFSALILPPDPHCLFSFVDLIHLQKRTESVSTTGELKHLKVMDLKQHNYYVNTYINWNYPSMIENKLKANNLSVRWFSSTTNAMSGEMPPFLHSISLLMKTELWMTETSKYHVII